MAKKVYAIKEGFNRDKNIKIENLIVDTWAECLAYVKGIKGAKYKSFESRDEAEKFLCDTKDVLKKEDKNYPMDCLHIYVDGSYNISSEQYSYGMVAMKNDLIEHLEGGVGSNGSSRNIRQIAGELDATVKGVEYALEKGEKKVVIFHDYIGICYHATGFWERKEESSKKYYEKMQEFMKAGIDIVFVKVDSHTGDLYNELADEICKAQLGINSDKVVEKWLANNTIKVSNDKLKESLSSIVGNNTENIIVVNNKEKNQEHDAKNNYESLVDLYSINKEKVINEVKAFKGSEKDKFIEYLLEELN